MDAAVDGMSSRPIPRPTQFSVRLPLLELQRCRSLPAYTDVIGKVTGTFVYKVCVASTTTCAANSSVTF